MPVCESEATITTPSRMWGSRSDRGVPANYSSCLRKSQDVVERYTSRGQRKAPTSLPSMNTRFASTDASTRSTPFARYSASLVMQWRRHMPDFIPATGRTLHVVGVCVNRIGIAVRSILMRDWDPIMMSGYLA